MAVTLPAASTVPAVILEPIEMPFFGVHDQAGRIAIIPDKENPSGGAGDGAEIRRRPGIDIDVGVHADIAGQTRLADGIVSAMGFGGIKSRPDQGILIGRTGAINSRRQWYRYCQRARRYRWWRHNWRNRHKNLAFRCRYQWQWRRCHK